MKVETLERITELEEKVEFQEQLIATLGILTIQTVSMFKDEKTVNEVLFRFSKALDNFVNDDNCDTSIVVQGFKEAITDEWGSRRKTH